MLGGGGGGKEVVCVARPPRKILAFLDAFWRGF